LVSDHIFQDAYDRVRCRHNDWAWLALSPREIADAIYREMRIIDHERLARTNTETAEPGSASVVIAAE
jgi:hypothetical protein